jgi:hypothetical protein
VVRRFMICTLRHVLFGLGEWDGPMMIALDGQR